ncbi:hypothetical protein HDZ31DRAFT_69239 [Schizophyllum fasciatum]
MPPKGRVTGTRRQLPWDNDTKTRLIVLVYTTDRWRKVIVGPSAGENTIGLSKPIAFQEIAADLFPVFVQEVGPVNVGSRVQDMYDSIHKTYKQQEKRLRRTGEGLSGEGGMAGRIDTYCMVSSCGPDESTDPDIRSIWDEIVASYPWFPTMHEYCGRPPTIIPPTQITAVSPIGRLVQHNHLGPPPMRQPLPAAHSFAIEHALATAPYSAQSAQHGSSVEPPDDMPLPASQLADAHGLLSHQVPSQPSAQASSSSAGRPGVLSAPPTLQHTTSKSLTRAPSLQGLVDKAEKKYKPTASKRGLEELLGENIRETVTIFKKRLEHEQETSLHEYALREKTEIHRERDDLFRATQLGLYTPRTASRRLKDIDARAKELEKYSLRVRKRLRQEMQSGEPSSDDAFTEVPSSPASLV